MARAWKVTVLRPGMTLAEAARAITAVRIAELYSFAPFIDDPARVEELHNMRISAKRLRYTLEIFRLAFPPPIEELIEQVKTIQEQIGRVHDADVMADLLDARLRQVAAEQVDELIAAIDPAAGESSQRAAIMGRLDPSASDRRVGLAALLGRTLRRRRRRYDEFLAYWRRLEAEGFRRRLLDITEPPPATAQTIAGG